MAGKLQGRAISNTANIVSQTITVGNSTSNSVINSTAVATPSVNVGSNVFVNTSTIHLGNSTVNTVIHTTGFTGNGAGLHGINADSIATGTLNTSRLPATVNVSTAINVGANLNINTSAIFIGNSTVNTTIIAGNVDLQGTQLRVGNVIVNGNQLSVGNVTITDAQITVGNSTVNTVLGSTGSLSGNGSQLTSVNAIALEGNSVANILTSANTAANTLASAAFTNAASRADAAYSNAVSYAASNTYVNNTFLPLAGGTLTGNLTVNATANIVSNLSANNVTFRGNVQIDGNLVVSGTSVTLNVASFAVEDNILHLNNGSTETHPDLGLAGNYNDGTYKHAGIFRDATDGVWKVFDGYTPEPNTAFIDTSNASFRIANFTANVITGASFSGNGVALTSINASSISSGTLDTARLPATVNVSTALNVGANVNLSTTGISIGNVVVNSSLTSTSFAVGGNTATFGTAAYVVANGNVGIGDSSPSTRLRVSGGRSVFAANSEGYSIAVQHNSGSVGQFYIGATNSANPDMLFSNTGGTETVRFAANGNVGVGTSSPFSKFQVGSHTFNGGNGTNSNDRVGLGVHGFLTSIMYASSYNDATYPDYGMVFVHGANTSNYNVWSVSPDGPAKGTGLNFIYGLNATNIHVATPKVVFSGNGNVGIGTSTPAGRLSISGNTSSSLPIVDITASGTGTFMRGVRMLNSGMASGNHIMYALGYADNSKNMGQFYFYYDSSGSNSNRISMGLHSVDDVFNIAGSGNIGINITTPATKLHIVNNSVSGVGAVPSNVTTIYDNSGNNYILMRTSADNNSYAGLLFQDNNVGGYIAFRNYAGSGANDGTNGDALYFGTYTDFIFQTGTAEAVNGKTERVRIQAAGHILPAANGTQNLGSSTLRWGTVFTSDLDLSNGIGDWTIVEGEDDLFIYNNKRGKVYKFNLTEVDPASAVPKKENQ